MSSATRQTSPSSKISSESTAGLSPLPPPTNPTPKYLRSPLPSGKPQLVFITAVALLLLPVWLLELPVLRHTHGNILFPLDNAYLNSTVGRNLAFYQVWGLSKYAFQSASSSLLYPFVLAPVFFIAGAHLLIPLIVNFVAAAWFLLALQRSLIRYGLSPMQQLLALLAALMLTLLPLLTVSGMEYTLQLLFGFLFLDSLVEALSGPGPSTNTADPLPRHVYLYGMLAIAARYEDILLIGLACILLGIQRGRRPALQLLLISIAPAVLFGIINLTKHSYFLPNPLLVGPYPAYAVTLAVLAIAVAGVLLVRYARLPETKRSVILPRLALGMLVLLILPFTIRNVGRLTHFQRDCIRVYDQQYPLANFVHLYYFKRTVGTNLPGAVSWFSEGRKLDYTGVASPDVVRGKRGHFWTAVYADSLSRKDGVRAAIVADPWFSEEQLPDNWEKIASWNIPDNGPNGPNGLNAPNQTPGQTLSFYSVNKYDTTWLLKSLREYQQLLPAGVSVRYY